MMSTLLRILRRAAAVALPAVLGACASAPTPAPEDTVVILPYVTSFSEAAPGAGLPPGWRPWVLARFKKPTEYRLVDRDGVSVVEASATSSASGLVHRLRIDPRQYPLLHWHWKVDELIAGADNTRRQSEDSPVRIVISFDGDLEKLDFDDRMFFDQVRTFTGQQLPYATLMYIWENRAPVGTVIPNLHTSRIKMVVAESGHDRLGRWREETRNVYEDFRRAFGEEPGTITSIGIMTDTDNTGEKVHAWYGDITFRRIAPPRTLFPMD